MPRTEAGKRLLRDMGFSTRRWSERAERLSAAIDAIEAEAREDEFDKGWSKGKAWGEKQERARIADGVEGLRTMKRVGVWVERAAVLDIIDREDSDHATD